MYAPAWPENGAREFGQLRIFRDTSFITRDGTWSTSPTSRGSPLLGENAAARIVQLNILDAVFVAVAQRDYRAAERNLAKTMAADFGAKNLFASATLRWFSSLMIVLPI